MCERLKPNAKALIGPYQCGFISGKCTIDQIFTLRRIREKRHENQVKTHHLFVDFKAAFHSPVRDRVYNAMSELGIPANLIRLCRMTLSSSCSFVKIGKVLSELFDTVRGFRQGAMSELDSPAKMIRLCRMMLSNSCSSVSVAKELRTF